MTMWGSYFRCCERIRASRRRRGGSRSWLRYYQMTTPRLDIAEICLRSTGVVSGEFGFVEAYRTRKAQIETWLTDSRMQVRNFAKRFVRRLEQSIAAEQRRAEENKEMRRRHYEDPEKA